MVEQIETQGFINGLLSKVGEILDGLEAYFAEVEGIRILSFVLLVIAIVLFLLSFIAMGIHRFMSIIKSGSSDKASNKASKNDEDGTENIFNFEDEDDLEKELQRELEFAANEQQRQELELQQLEEKERLEKENKERLEKEQQEMQKKEQEKKQKEQEKKAQQEKELNTFKEHKSYK